MQRKKTQTEGRKRDRWTRFVAAKVDIISILPNKSKRKIQNKKKDNYKWKH